jgi:hypothetical protein
MFGNSRRSVTATGKVIGRTTNSGSLTPSPGPGTSGLPGAESDGWYGAEVSNGISLRLTPFFGSAASGRVGHIVVWGSLPVGNAWLYTRLLVLRCVSSVSQFSSYTVGNGAPDTNDRACSGIEVVVNNTGRPNPPVQGAATNSSHMSVVLDVEDFPFVAFQLSTNQTGGGSTSALTSADAIGLIVSERAALL